MADKLPAYMGEGFSLRGEKDRFVLPPDFRKTFEDIGDERILCIAKESDLPCLIAFGLSRTAYLEEMLEEEARYAQQRGAPFNRRLRAGQLFTCGKVPFDASGRFILPQKYCKIGNISDNICFMSGGQVIMLWDLDQLGAMGPDWADQYELFLASAEEARAKAAAKGKGA